MKEVKKVIEDIVTTLTEVQQEYIKLEKNLYNTQLQFDFGETHGDKETILKTDR
tara:strand:- start:52 stop:213 length:162 start_codon:yes stop_codon:yes gene_type:complete